MSYCKCSDQSNLEKKKLGLSGVLCTSLYPTENVRSGGNTTFAIRNIIEGQNLYPVDGISIKTVVKFIPILSRSGLFLWPRKRTINKIRVYEIPRCSFRYWHLPVITQAYVKISGFKYDFDFIVSHLVYDFSVALSSIVETRDSPKILVLHASDMFQKERLFSIYQKADSIFSRSHALLDQFRIHKNITSRGVLYSGIEKEIISPCFNKDRAVLKIVIACVFIPLKNIINTLNAIKRISLNHKVEVELFGDGELRKKIEEEINFLNLGMLVNMHGFVERPLVLKHMAQSHLFIMPSSPETFGLAYLEAMASGCIVIGHKGWGIDGIVKDGYNGYLVEDAKPEMIEEKIASYLASDRDALHRSSLETVKKYSYECSVSNYFSSLRSAILNIIR